MPIRPEQRWFYPIDWPQLSATIRFRRAKWRCEQCGRPHGRDVLHLGDGRWFDEERKQWRNDKGRRARGLTAANALRRPHQLCFEDLAMPTVSPPSTRVVLASAHLDHDPSKTIPPISLPCASGATWHMIVRNIVVSAGGRSSGAARWAICSSACTGKALKIGPLSYVGRAVTPTARFNANRVAIR